MLTWAFALTVAVVSPATCLLGAQLITSERESCHTIDHDALTTAVGKDWCALGDALGVAALAGGPQLPPPAVTVLSVAARNPLPDGSSLAFGPVDISSSSPPVYIAVSSLRI